MSNRTKSRKKICCLVARCHGRRRGYVWSPLPLGVACQLLCSILSAQPNCPSSGNSGGSLIGQPACLEVLPLVCQGVMTAATSDPPPWWTAAPHLRDQQLARQDHPFITVSTSPSTSVVALFPVYLNRRTSNYSPFQTSLPLDGLYEHCAILISSEAFNRSVLRWWMARRYL